jgi:hypothetical protein
MAAGAGTRRCVSDLPLSLTGVLCIKSDRPHAYGDGHTSIYTSDCARSAAEEFLIEPRSEANRIAKVEPRHDRASTLTSVGGASPQLRL